MEELIRLKKLYEKKYNDWLLSKTDIGEVVISRNIYLDYCKNNKDESTNYDNYKHICFIVENEILNEKEIDSIESKWLSCHRIIIEYCSLDNLKKYIINPIYNDDYIFSKIYKRLSESEHVLVNDMYNLITKNNILLLKSVINYSKNKKHIAKAKLLI